MSGKLEKSIDNAYFKAACNVQKHFGQRVIEMYEFLKHKVLVSHMKLDDDPALTDVYSYLYEQYRLRMESLLTCPEDYESKDFIFDIIDHKDDILSDNFEFLRVKYQWYSEITGEL